MASKKSNEKNVNAPAPQSSGAPEQVSTLAQVPTSAVQNAMPAWLAAKLPTSGGRGLEEVEKDDLIFPRLVLCQSQSPAVLERKAQLGDIIDNLTNEVLCRAGDTLKFVPVLFSKSRMHLIPIDDGGGTLCRSDDSRTARPGGDGVDQGGQYTRTCADCIRKEWRDGKGADGQPEDDNAPECSVFYNIVGILPDHGGRVAVLSCKSTQIRMAKRMLSACKATGADFWAHRFNLFSVTQTSGKFTFQNFDFQALGYVSQEEYGMGAKLYESVSGKTFAVDTSDLEAAPADADTSFPDTPTTPAQNYEATRDAAAEPAPARVPAKNATVDAAKPTAPAKTAPASDDGF